jgi:glycosyltransferase involved in cell wall biosynthesis
LIRLTTTAAVIGRSIPGNDDGVDLTVCVIGRNEAANLPACASSLAVLGAAGLRVETIFVDSASTDRSVEMAKRHFDVVLELEANNQLNAGAARAVGTAEATGRWMLYLDGDMRLRAEFVPQLLALLAGTMAAEGLAGQTRNVYPDGSTDLMLLVGNRPGLPCKAFGGAVLLRRDVVLAAGNWAPNLFSNEESELYSRLLQRSARVLWTETPMVDHVTPKHAPAHKLLGSLWPWGSHLGKKFFGAGQVTRRAWLHDHLTSFVRLKPLQYTMTAALLVSAIGLLVSPRLAPWPAVLVSLWITALRGPKFAVNCICWTSQTLFGLSKLDPSFKPTLRQVHRTGRAQPTLPL